MDAIKLAQFGWRCIQHRDEIKDLLTRLEPYAIRLKKDWPELQPRVKGLIQALFPEEPPPEVPHYDVNWIQTSLNTLGYGPLEVDGVYGPATHKAVSEFQKLHDLTVDSWAGAMTCAAIAEELRIHNTHK